MISIVIVNWNSGPLLERCIQSLRQHASGCEIIVVDNASADGSLDFLGDPRPGMRVLRNATNLGFAAGNNLGWRQSAGDSVLFLNPDTECKPGAPSKLERKLGGDSRIWAVAGRLLPFEGREATGFNVRSFPTLGAVAAEMLLLDELWPGNPWSRRYRGSDRPQAPGFVDQPAGACLMVRRDILDRLNGFDGVYTPAWFEDVDLCRRIHLAGGKIWFEPEAEFLHHGGSSLKQLSHSDFLEIYHTNQLRYFRKHHGRKQAVRVRRLIVIGMFLRAFASLVYPGARRARGRRSAAEFWRAARHFLTLQETTRAQSSG